MHLSWKTVGLLAVGVAAAVWGTSRLPTVSAHLHLGSPSGSTAAGRATPFQHVYIIMMENEGTGQIIGNPALPYINHLASRYGYDNNYFGVTHESLANYVAFLSGSNWGTHSDNPTQRFDHSNLVDQLAQHHLSWKGYMESLPSTGYAGNWYPDNLPAGSSAATTPSTALYALKHDPFLLMTDIVDSASRRRHVVPYTEFIQDLHANRVPNFSWITPNMVNDMHGTPTVGGQELFSAGDQFIKTAVQSIMGSTSWKTSKSVIFITWDEAAYPSGTPTAQELKAFTAPGPDAPVVPAGSVDGFNWPGGPYGGGQVPLIIVDNASRQHFVIHTWADHYSLLRTIEQNWHLGFLGHAAGGRHVRTLPIPGEP